MPTGTKRNQWAPAARLGVYEKEEGLGYRWCEDEPENIERKRQEGWTVVNKVTGQRGEPSDELNATSGGKKHRELVLMSMDQETLEARAKYHEGLNSRQESAIYRDTKEELSRMGAQPHGKVVIE